MVKIKMTKKKYMNEVDAFTIIFLLGYLTPSQWSSAWNDDTTDNKSILCLIQELNELWGGLDDLLEELNKGEIK